MDSNSILVISPYFRPAERAGGPVVSLGNLVDGMAGEVSFKIVCSSRDIDGRELDFNSCPSNADLKILPVASLRDLFTFEFVKIFRSVDRIYLNSVYSITFSLLPVFLAVFFLKVRMLIIAPRGELSAKAVGTRGILKPLYLRLFRLLTLGATWHATSKLEAGDVKKWFGCQQKICTIPNIPTLFDIPHRNRILSVKESLNLAVVGRVCKFKGQEFLAEVIGSLDRKVNIKFLGPVEDLDSKARCEQILRDREHVSVKWSGLYTREQLPYLLGDIDLVCIPSLSENFCHVGYEALSLNKPLLVSPAIPFSQQSEIVFVVPREKHLWVSFLQKYKRAEITESDTLRIEYKNYIESCLNLDQTLKSYRGMFLK